MMINVRTSAFAGLGAVLAIAVTFPGQATAAGTISGKVSFEGAAPARRTVKMAADPACDAANPDGRLGEVMVVDGGKLANVFVYIKEGLGEQTFETPKAPSMPNTENIEILQNCNHPYLKSPGYAIAAPPL